MKTTALLTLGALLALPGPGIEAQEAEAEPVKVRIEDRVVVKKGDPKVRVVVVGDEEEGTRFWTGGDGEAYAFVTGVGSGGFLGVALTALTPELREHFGAPSGAGVLVSKVEPGSPAEAAGLRVGDVVTALDGEAMKSAGDVRRHVRALEEGTPLAVEVLRDGRIEQLSATIVERERPEVDVRDLLSRIGEGGEGFAYEFNTEAMAEAMANVERHFSSPEFRAQMERLRSELDSPEFQERMRSFSNLQLELGDRIEELEERIRELERELEAERER